MNIYHEDYKKQKRKTKIIGGVAMALIGIIFLSLFAWLLSIGNGLEKYEINECNKWKEQAEVYPDYYLLEWQEQQCDRHEIEINAPVK